MNGIINVLKPPGMTSHDVVNFIRKTINIKRVGHTGTLDPNAAGVLPICIGKATRVVQYFDDFNKVYRAELTLGYETDTQDKYGEVINKLETYNVTYQDIERVFNKFKGKIKQIPPMYSAIKYNGKKLYELAREGKTIERQPREIIIHDLKILKNYDNKRIMFDANCSKGTYIRTLCNDLGREIGALGCMTFLLRKEVGDFKIEDSYTLEEIKEYANAQRLADIVLPIDSALKHYSHIEVDKGYFQILKNGGKIKLDNNHIKSFSNNNKKSTRVYCNEKFIGIGLIEKDNIYTILKMDKVFL
ncbi:tRNA pseudouridine55 synthase [Proteiniborus ethanoligenes]|uniref:tRNA pseudouridine synthase B n=1 Tax=Proteiniborus ethanoligenes TaxID=415015 RepID=A0A1H3N7K7_9FIRM|nr:tRNA pseudouridine(55) synthase TruB [Proteiniborus ethanoligenes]TAH63739.1 MAG: tRNA pseudouridine(55) synthase TruB [Gottschalkiaceae bacterium]SDY84660.1 tRNA pseudouridine55 synthase [Proteiniborus ethanoligenes]